MSLQKQSKTGRLLLILAGLVGSALLVVGAVVVATRGNGNEVVNFGEVGRFEDNADRGLLDPPRQISDFTLSASGDTPVSLSDFRGSLVMLYFGYTNCPDACPATLLDFKRIKNALGDDANNIQFIMISVDPERDTPNVLEDYVTGYDPSFVGLTGTHDVLQQITEQFGVVYTRNDETTSQADYLVDHTVSKFLVDQEGQLVGVYSFMEEPSTIVDDVLSLLD